MKRSVALLVLAVGLVLSCVAGESAAQDAAGAKKLTVTLVRWPYT
jgi:ABC-type glycerol-3-phosphate transport system substrate-binding protein